MASLNAIAQGLNLHIAPSSTGAFAWLALQRSRGAVGATSRDGLLLRQHRATHGSALVPSPALSKIRRETAHDRIQAADIALTQKQINAIADLVFITEPTRAVPDRPLKALGSAEHVG